MDSSAESRRRNNRVIFLTAAVILMLSMLSVLSRPDGELVKISVGDSSFEVANLLSTKGVPFELFTSDSGEGLRVDYLPVSPMDRLRGEAPGSYYEVLFDDNKVADIVWRDRQGKDLDHRLSIKVVGRPKG